MAEPGYHMPWYEPGFEESFSTTLTVHVGVSGGGTVLDERRADYYPSLFSLWHKPAIDRPDAAPPTDVFMCTVSPPDRNGYCSFGPYLWYKRELAKHCKGGAGGGKRHLHTDARDETISTFRRSTGLWTTRPG